MVGTFFDGELRVARLFLLNHVALQEGCWLGCFRAVSLSVVLTLSRKTASQVVALRSGPPQLLLLVTRLFLLNPVVSFKEGCRLRCLRAASGFHGALRVARLLFLNRLLFGRAVG